MNRDIRTMSYYGNVCVANFDMRDAFNWFMKFMLNAAAFLNKVKISAIELFLIITKPTYISNDLVVS